MIHAADIGHRSVHLNWGFKIGRSLCIHSRIKMETQSSLRKVACMLEFSTSSMAILTLTGATGLLPEILGKHITENFKDEE